MQSGDAMFGRARVLGKDSIDQEQSSHNRHMAFDCLLGWLDAWLFLYIRDIFI